MQFFALRYCQSLLRMMDMRTDMWNMPGRVLYSGQGTDFKYLEEHLAHLEEFEGE